MTTKARSRPYCGGEPPKLEAGQERRPLIANINEDADEATARAKRKHAWGAAIMGRPTRGGQWWLFTIDTAKLAAVASAPHADQPPDPAVRAAPAVDA